MARGEASVLFGGPGGKVLTVRAGDVVVIPAGVAHCNQGQSDDLLIVGAYPDNGARPDLRRGAAVSTMRHNRRLLLCRCRRRIRLRGGWSAGESVELIPTRWEGGSLVG